MSKPVYIRNLRQDDLPAIVDIEDRTTGVSRKPYWQKRIEMSEAIRPHWTSLVAESDNRVVGFVFGRAGELEFGLPGTVAWIEIIGVDPAYRHCGIGAKLLEQFSSSAEDHGIQTIFTVIDKNNTDMERFFTRIGFSEGEMVHFQKTLKT
ncbi:MAG: GNAT family N-acetyltransferase [Acidobacteria bacterium]|nr:GNAT family N-acetyltransferase [Acidobacteriota bacterium]